MGMSLQSRLEALNSKGLRSVAQPLFDQLHEYKHRTLAAAKTAPATAAVQRCLILPNVEERVVKSLMSWLYGQGSLNFDDAQHL